MRIHLAGATLAVLMGVFFRLTMDEWLWLLLAIFLVVVMEIVNTVCENIVNLVTDYHFHPLAKNAKDMAAGAVLLTAIFAGIVGMILFLPKIIHQLIVFMK